MPLSKPNVGSGPNAGNGDKLRDAFVKVNAAIDQIDLNTGDIETLQNATGVSRFTFLDNSGSAGQSLLDREGAAIAPGAEAESLFANAHREPGGWMRWRCIGTTANGDSGASRGNLELNSAYGFEIYGLCAAGYARWVPVPPLAMFSPSALLYCGGYSATLGGSQTYATQLAATAGQEDRYQTLISAAGAASWTLSSPLPGKMDVRKTLNFLGINAWLPRLRHHGGDFSTATGTPGGFTPFFDPGDPDAAIAVHEMEVWESADKDVGLIARIGGNADNRVYRQQVLYFEGDGNFDFTRLPSCAVRIESDDSPMGDYDIRVNGASLIILGSQEKGSLVLRTNYCDHAVYIDSDPDDSEEVDGGADTLYVQLHDTKSRHVWTEAEGFDGSYEAHVFTEGTVDPGDGSPVFYVRTGKKSLFTGLVRATSADLLWLTDKTTINGADELIFRGLSFEKCKGLIWHRRVSKLKGTCHDDDHEPGMAGGQVAWRRDRVIDASNFHCDITDCQTKVGLWDGDASADINANGLLAHDGHHGHWTIKPKGPYPFDGGGAIKAGGFAGDALYDADAGTGWTAYHAERAHGGSIVFNEIEGPMRIEDGVTASATGNFLIHAPRTWQNRYTAYLDAAEVDFSIPDVTDIADITTDALPVDAPEALFTLETRDPTVVFVGNSKDAALRSRSQTFWTLLHSNGKYRVPLYGWLSAGGDDTGHMLARIPHALALDPDLIVVGDATNNIDDSAGAISDYEDMVAAVRAAGKVIAIPRTPANTSSGAHEASRNAINSAVDALAAADVLVWDTPSAFDPSTESGKTYDGIHPNTIGANAVGTLHGGDMDDACPGTDLFDVDYTGELNPNPTMTGADGAAATGIEAGYAIADGYTLDNDTGATCVAEKHADGSQLIRMTGNATTNSAAVRLYRTIVQAIAEMQATEVAVRIEVSNSTFDGPPVGLRTLEVGGSSGTAFFTQFVYEDDFSFAFSGVMRTVPGRLSVAGASFVPGCYARMNVGAVDVGIKISQMSARLEGNVAFRAPYDMSQAVNNAGAKIYSAETASPASGAAGTVFTTVVGAVAGGNLSTSYQWKRASDDSNVSGANTRQWTSTGASAGNYYCAITYTNSFGSLTKNTPNITVS